MFNFAHRFQLRFAVIAAAALLFAQLGAMTHAYSHRPSSAPPSAQQSTGSAHEFCSDCLNFAPLLAAAGAPSTLPFSIPHGHLPSAASLRDSLIERRAPLYFRSRAPPAAT